MIKPRKTIWDRFSIAAEIRRRGFSLQSLGEHLGIDGGAMRLGLRAPYKRVNRAIADFLAVPVHELWPCWYDEDGDLLPPKYRAKLSRQRAESASRESQNIAAGG